MGFVPPRIIPPLNHNEQFDITDEPFNPREAWNRVLLENISRPASLYTPEPTYAQLFEDLRLSVGQLILSIWQGMVNFIGGFYTSLAAFIFPNPVDPRLAKDRQGRYLWQPYHPPQSITSDVPVSNSVQALSDSLLLMARAGKVDLLPKHQEIEPYTPQPEYEDMQFAPSDWTKE